MKSKCCEEVERRQGYADMKVVWYSEDFVSTWQEPVFDVFGYFERSGEGRIGVV